MKKSGNSLIYKVSYHELAVELDLPRLDKSVLRELYFAIETKLHIAPDIFGKPLRGPLHGYWSLRVGDYRVAYRIIGQKVSVECIKHRREIYKELQKRFGF
ncbi:MAG: type II toxin-antitoxin system RelE/ParE family toxin [bacterium]|nr:type II toxin-antitoxin system RelE/ParE family toxin [bacterium]